MKRIDDDLLWKGLVALTPPQAGGETAEEAARLPGNHVKSREIDTDGSDFPKYHGILVRYDAWAPTFVGVVGGNDINGCVIVRSIGTPVSRPGTFWIGTTYEYHQMWEVD